MQPPRSVALHDEARPLSRTAVLERLGRALRIALAAIVAERHGRIIADRAARLNTFDIDPTFFAAKGGILRGG